MATTQVPKINNEEKLGGPYTREEREERRKQVYEMHFEKGESAQKIAEMLGMNRNTINSDIKYWYTQMASQIGGENVCGILLQQIDRFEIQRTRLLEIKTQDFASTIKLEKMITEIDNKIAGVASRLIGRDLEVDKFRITEEIPKEEISKIVKYLIFDAGHLDPECVLEDQIIEGIIKKEKCDIAYPRNVINIMRKLGLVLCYVPGNAGLNYDLLKFASMRGIITKEEEQSFFKKRQDKENKVNPL
jgi:hypothetical protein